MAVAKRLIYAEDVLENIDRDRAYMTDVGRIHARAAVNAAPTVEPKKGRWEWYADRCEDLFLGCDDDYGWRCSRCKTPLEDCDDPEVPPTFKFCPNCGADMRGEEDGNS